MKKYLLHAIIIGCVFIGLTACAKQKKTGPLLQGRALEQQGEYTAALKHYEGMKDESFRQENIQNLHYLYGDILEAIQAIDNGDSSGEQYYQLGEAYYEKSQSIPDMAATEPNAGLDLNNYFTHQREQLQENALTALNTSTQTQPSNLDALWLEGTLHEERGDAEQAVLAYQKMLQIVSENVGSLAKNETDTMPIPEDPEFRHQNAKALTRLGQLLFEQGEHEEGLQLVKQAIFYDPGYAEAYFGLGELYARQGDSAHSIIQYEAALCIDPSYLEAYYRIARVYLLRGEPVEAERVLRLGRINNPEALHLGLFHGVLQENLDRQEQSKAEQIVQLLEGDLVTNDLGALDISGQNYEVQLLYFDLRLRVLQRQRPYWLACGEREEHPYFATQIDRTQAKINMAEGFLTSSE